MEKIGKDFLDWCIGFTDMANKLLDARLLIMPWLSIEIKVKTVAGIIAGGKILHSIIKKLF